MLDDAVLIQILERILTNVRYIPCNFLRSELRISRLPTSYSSIWIDVSASSMMKSFIEHDSILVVVSFPCHESHEEVLSESQITVFRGRTVRNDLSLVHMFIFA